MRTVKGSERLTRSLDVILQFLHDLLASLYELV